MRSGGADYRDEARLERLSRLYGLDAQSASIRTGRDGLRAARSSCANPNSLSICSRRWAGARSYCLFTCTTLSPRAEGGNVRIRGLGG